MDIHLKVKLQDAIERWYNDNFDEDDWPERTYMGNKTIPLMTDAAETVLDAVVEIQDYIENTIEK